MPLHICPRCHRIFDRKSNYEQHLRRKIPCQLADQKPEPVISLPKIPVQLTLKEEPKYNCELCGQSFTRISNLKRHQESRCVVTQKKIEMDPEQNDSHLSESSEGE